MGKLKVIIMGLLMGLTLTACGSKDDSVATSKEPQSSATQSDASTDGNEQNGCVPYKHQVVCKVDKVSGNDIYLTAIDPVTVSESVDKNDPKRYLGDFNVDDKIVASKNLTVAYDFVNNHGVTGTEGTIKYVPEEGDILFILYNEKGELNKNDGTYDMRNEKNIILLQQYVNTLEGTVEDTYNIKDVYDLTHPAIKLKVTKDSLGFKKGDVVSVVYDSLDNGNKIPEKIDLDLKINKGDNVYFDYGVYEADNAKESIDKGEEATLNPAYLMIGEPAAN